MKEIEQEFNEALFKVGITDLFSAEKFASKIERHFERAGNLDILKEYVDKVNKRPDHQLMEEFVVCKWNGDNVKLPFYEILEQEGITFDPDNFLKLNGERVAFVGDEIIPLRCKKAELRETLERVIELRKELSYSEEVYQLPSYVDSENGWFDHEKGKWVYPEDFVQANKFAYDFDEFWRNIDKPIKESEDPFVQTLVHLDKLPEYDPEGELRQMQFAREFNRSQIKLKLLEELERTKVYKDKKWKVIPTTKLEMNPGYEEFFYNHLGDYSVEEIDNALKDLEGELVGDNRLKVRTLRKEFEKKEGISRKKKLGILLGGLVAGAAGCYIAYELTRDRKPPAIKDLKWEPTGIVNDKVYNGSVSFIVEDEEPVINIFGLKFPLYKTQISNATLEFIPKIYSHLPKEAFPNETIRRYNLIPVDGKFDERIEEFLVNITDIKGGREYDIKAIAQDQANNTDIASLTTPYIREFENFGKQLYDEGIIVGATYYVLYPNPHPWEPLEIRTHPILGKYNVTDPIVISKHVDWATGHGINTFFFSWGIFEDDNRTFTVHRNILNFISNPLSSQVHISILYELPHRLRSAGIKADEYGFFTISPNDNLSKISEDFKIITRDIISKTISQNFLSIERRPVIYLYESKGVKGSIETLIKAVNKPIEEILRIGGFLVSDHATPIALPPSEEFLETAKLYDGWTLWAGGYFRDREYSLEYLKNGLRGWKEIAENNYKPLISSVIPGFTDPRDPNAIPYPRNVKNFKEALELAFEYSFIPSPSKYKTIIRIDTFNEWGEDTGIEPTYEEKFMYLDALQHVLETYNRN